MKNKRLPMLKTNLIYVYYQTDEFSLGSVVIGNLVSFNKNEHIKVDAGQFFIMLTRNFNNGTNFKHYS